jgi:mycoredoxin
MAAAQEVVMYTTEWCGQCRSVKAFLDQNDIAYREVDIDEDPDAARRVTTITGGYRSVPTLVLPDGTVLVEPGRRQLAEAFSRD